MATDDVEFVAILTLRYMEPHLMGLAHDWVEQNAPAEIPGATACDPSISRRTAA